MHTLAADLAAAVAGVAGAALQRDLLPGKGLELLVELLLIPFHDHDVVHASAEQVAGVLALGVHGVAGHDHARQVGEGLQQRLEAGDLAGLLAYVELGQDQAGEVVAGGEQMDLAARGPGRSAQGLAVNRHRVQLTVGPSAPVCQPAAHRPVQRVAVDAAQQPPHRRLRRQAPLRGQRIGPYAKALQDGRRGVGDPLAHRQQGGRSGQNRARGQREHDDQSVPYAARIARVGHRGQSLQQARDLLGHGPGMLAEWVKGGRDRR